VTLCNGALEVLFDTIPRTVIRGVDGACASRSLEGKRPPVSRRRMYRRSFIVFVY
jgi:hypothetical protein